MGTTRQNDSGKQQKYLLPAVAFDDAQFDAYRVVVNANQKSVSDTPSQFLPSQASLVTRESANAAEAVFAGMTAKLDTWRFAEDSWRSDESV
jgi:hypothetical protein